jgi:hypothetical protein
MKDNINPSHYKSGEIECIKAMESACINKSGIEAIYVSNVMFENNVVTILDAIKKMLFEKNIKYGNSALNPCRIFSKQNIHEQLLVRIDDKLNRIRNSSKLEDEDVISDLLGYLILLKVSKL